jgi:hypothetical protein
LPGQEGLPTEKLAEPIAAPEPQSSQSAQPPQPQGDASLALKAQIEALGRSEQIQREAQEAVIAAHAAHERRLRWLAGNPRAQANVPALGHIHHAALSAGLADATDDYFQFLEQQLDALPDGTPAMPQPTPEFFRPPPAPKSPAPKVIHSAPVSRDVPAAGSGARPRGRVVLTPQEQEAAAMSGISIEEYARQKLKYTTMKDTGEYRDERSER